MKDPKEVCRTCLSEEKTVGVFTSTEGRLHRDSHPDHEVVSVNEEQEISN